MKPIEAHILTINGGSSSIKFALFELGPSLQRVLEGALEGIGSPKALFRMKGVNKADNFSKSMPLPTHTTAIHCLMDWLDHHHKLDTLRAVGHRIVHGGPKYYKTQHITKKMVDDLRQFSTFDPEHLPEEILLIEAFAHRSPHLTQIACFDTAFHHDLPRVAKLLPIPRRYEAQGVCCYGFHGLSYEFLLKELSNLRGPDSAKGRVILAHLGHGVSLAAVHHGQSIDTSMGFTPSSGLPMSTRSGDLDPGLFWYLANTEGCDAKDFYQMANFQSGLLGISEISADMRDLLEHEQHDVRAAEAISVFCYRIRKEIGAFAAALEGLDTLVFTGGIGENMPMIRSRICQGLAFLGIELDQKQNLANAVMISSKTSQVTVFVIPADEQKMIADKMYHILST